MKASGLATRGGSPAAVLDLALVGSSSGDLRDVGLVSDDLKLDQSAGICGRESQNVPVGAGDPIIESERMTAGGAD